MVIRIVKYSVNLFADCNHDNSKLREIINGGDKCYIVVVFSYCVHCSPSVLQAIS